ncbi:MAG: translation initiation factor IF-3 [Patescibacteria group bacterium]|nr:translation initiation factor IF-3 [bacterium]MDZ4240778.1 translation initiation factor IF-3 [Patescibacteria group bacterium]
MAIHIRINNAIRAPQLRVIGPQGENFGVISLSEALSKAKEMGLDLIEISPAATPPVAKIFDYGKFQYAEQKKQKITRTKVHTVEVKNIQVKIGTGDHDLALKAKKVSEWLKEGNRVRVDLFLSGRAKYLEFGFLRTRLERLLKLLTENYSMAEPITKGPKGLTSVIEKERK